jgi:hypothetical protein
MTTERPEVAAWTALVDGLRDAGDRLAADTEALDDIERADAYRALLRALGNQLGRFEVDRERPELVAFNGWRQKFLMDNPDFRYWVADVRADRRYRITGNRGEAAYVSVTAYSSGGTTEARATARLDSDGLTFDDDGGFIITVGGERPPSGDWLELPDGATSLWVRQFHDDVRTDRPGHCAIEPLDDPPVPAVIDPARFAHQVGRLAATMSSLPKIFAGAVRADGSRVNELREWSEMTGGAVFTEPNIRYLRGGWQLAPGEALVIEGEVVPCRYWNVLLYSRFLNSLDHRWRPVSRTGATATVTDGRYRLVLAAEDPGPGHGDWLDTEGRPFGIVVVRFLQPDREPTLPTTRVVAVDDLRRGR